MKALLALLLLAATGCATASYHTTRFVGTNAVQQTTFSSKSLFSTTNFKGLVVDGNGSSRADPGLRITGLATDPNSQSITATADALGSLIGAAAAAAAKGAK